MSSATTRNNPGRDPYDYYPTPPWCVHRLLDKIGLPLIGTWFEPASGDGAIVRAVHSWCKDRNKSPPLWITNDIRQDAQSHYNKDFSLLASLEFFQQSEFTVFLTNPPFSLADRFLEQALRLKGPHGRPPIIGMLLRLQWMETRGRAPLMQRHTPTLAILPDRPNFTVTGNGDMCEYAWHIWNHPDHEKEVMVLDTTDRRLRAGRPTHNYEQLFERQEAKRLFTTF